MDSVECRRALDYAYSRLKENDPTGALEAVVAVIKGTMGEASVAPLLEQAASRSRLERETHAVADEVSMLLSALSLSIGPSSNSPSAVGRGEAEAASTSMDMSPRKMHPPRANHQGPSSTGCCVHAAHGRFGDYTAAPWGDMAETGGATRTWQESASVPGPAHAVDTADGHRGGGGLTLLEEQGKGEMVQAALGDGSSFLCLKCGGVYALTRRDAHHLWCPG